MKQEDYGQLVLECLGLKQGDKVYIKKDNGTYRFFKIENNIKGGKTFGNCSDPEIRNLEGILEGYTYWYTGEVSLHIKSKTNELVSINNYKRSTD